MKSSVCKLGLLSALAFFTGSATATVITFEDIASPGSLTTYHDAGFTTQGFDFLLDHGHVIDAAYAPGSHTFGDGSDWLKHDYPGPMQVTKSGGGLFSLQQFDYGSFYNYTTVYTFTVTGYYADNSTISMVLGLTPGVSTQVLSPAWSNLALLEFAGYNTQAYDNFVFGPSSDVPAPASLALVGIGLASLLGLRRRKA